MENKTYDILELQKMSTIELASLAETYDVEIQNNFKQGLIYAILDRQDCILQAQAPNELHARDRYALFMILVSALLFFCSCATNRPGSASLHRNVQISQEVQQYQNCTSSGRDCGRFNRSQQRYGQPIFK